jgi:hypothetical protein
MPTDEVEENGRGRAVGETPRDDRPEMDRPHDMLTRP